MLGRDENVSMYCYKIFLIVFYINCKFRDFNSILIIENREYTDFFL